MNGIHSSFVTYKTTSKHYSFSGSYIQISASLVAQTVKNLPVMQENQVQSLGWGVPWSREWLPTPVFLPVESHGHWRLVGSNPWGYRVGHDWMTNIFEYDLKYTSSVEDASHNLYNAWSIAICVTSFSFLSKLACHLVVIYTMIYCDKR